MKLINGRYGSFKLFNGYVLLVHNDKVIWLQSLEDEYNRKLQEEAKELEQLLDKKNAFSAKEEEYTKKIRELGPLTSDAFET